MSLNRFEEAVDYVEREHQTEEGREFEASVRESLSALGFETRLVADGELNGEVVDNYEVETTDGTYGLEIRRESGELEVYDRN